MSICCSHRGFSTSVIGAVSFLVLGCPSSTARKAQLTAPIAMKGVDKELDTGHISVHAAVAREVPFGEERLTFGQLTDAVRIFSLLQGSNQASRLKSTYSSFSAGASVSSPLLESLAISETSNRETKSTESTSGSSTTADGKTSTESTSTALGDDSLRLGGGREAEPLVAHALPVAQVSARSYLCRFPPCPAARSPACRSSRRGRRSGGR